MTNMSIELLAKGRYPILLTVITDTILLPFTAARHSRTNNSPHDTSSNSTPPRTNKHRCYLRVSSQLPADPKTTEQALTDKAYNRPHDVNVGKLNRSPF